MEQTRKRGFANHVLQGIILLLIILMAGAFTTEVNAAAKKKTLIVYYSRTNTTQQIAKKIQKLINADMVRLKTKNAYPSDYDEMLETAQREQDENARPEMADRISNWSQYDKIILGYPIWYGQAPKIISTFLESYDFSGKTIVPFCTSGGSGLGTSASSLHSLVSSDAAWKTGIRFTAGASAGDIQTWLKSEGIQPFTGASAHAI
ncbi:MAG: flavodoxin [Firmicutes bacterium]|nr:flavodoxin [Bacillota bacterium]